MNSGSEGGWDLWLVLTEGQGGCWEIGRVGVGGEGDCKLWSFARLLFVTSSE